MNKTPKSIKCIVVTPEDSTYEQEVTVKPGETEQQAAKRLEKMLGKDYYVADWYDL